MKIKDLRFLKHLSSISGFIANINGQYGKIEPTGSTTFRFRHEGSTNYNIFSICDLHDAEYEIKFIDRDDFEIRNLFIVPVKFTEDLRNKLKKGDYIYVQCKKEKEGQGGFFGTVTRIETFLIFITHNEPEYSGSWDNQKDSEYGNFCWSLGECCEIRYVPTETKVNPSYITRKVADCSQGDYVEYEGQRGYLDKKGNGESILCFDEKTKDFGWKSSSVGERCLGKYFGWWISDHSVVRLLETSTIHSYLEKDPLMIFDEIDDDEDEEKYEEEDEKIEMPSARTFTEQMIQDAEELQRTTRSFPYLYSSTSKSFTAMRSFLDRTLMDSAMESFGGKEQKENYFKKIFNSFKLNPMSTLTKKFLGLFITEPQKTFRKLNITDEQGRLTGEGAELFHNWLLSKFGEEFRKEVCAKLLEEQEQENKE